MPSRPRQLSYGVGNSTAPRRETIRSHGSASAFIIVNPRSSRPVASTFPMAIPDFSTVLPQLTAQKLRALAVLTRTQPGAAGRSVAERNAIPVRLLAWPHFLSATCRRK